jgi:hypothetical protein
LVVSVLEKIKKESTVPVILKTLENPMIFMKESAKKPTVSSLTFSCISEPRLHTKLTSSNILRIDEKVDS